VSAEAVLVLNRFNGFHQKAVETAEVFRGFPQHLAEARCEWDYMLSTSIMKIAVGADHGGFPLNQRVIAELRGAGHEIEDFGTHDGTRPDDYPDYAIAVGRAIQTGKVEIGILICGSGVGACVAANKLHGVRAALCSDTYSAHQSREHDDCNVLCLGARVIGPELAMELVRSFVAARFTGEERHVRRLAKVEQIERVEEGKR
jgi:ribose 5-phosphate isomerase B